MTLTSDHLLFQMADYVRVHLKMNYLQAKCVRQWFKFMLFDVDLLPGRLCSHSVPLSIWMYMMKPMLYNQYFSRYSDFDINDIRVF